MAEYRIVTDNASGFMVQARRWWWPFWLQVGFNSSSSAEGARQWIEREFAYAARKKNAGKVVEHLGRWTS
ncbi:hypothetical protein EOD42_13950 [Rhodovarius crocodyli]|uniref:Uncharacterized protein n=1 Tax=Rhodovarius crocodyli TaxID=1979269 RepID=A0A437MEY1_9PROT|nr:hypothetical protein [Rhodovarius crocodyli]RVT96214.1 hypothetical protein EOD42_13950 [Rhodovarius crocodyli]